MPRYVFGAEEGLRLLGVRDGGNLARERVVLRAKSDLNLIQYAVLPARHSEGSNIRDLNRDVFWFPSLRVREGEYVRLYTRVGVRDTSDGTWGDEPARYHNIFWGRTAAVWTGRADAAVVIEIASWSMVPVKTE